MDRSSFAAEFEELLNVGIALSSIHDLEKLLDMILLEARRLTTWEVEPKLDIADIIR